MTVKLEQNNWPQYFIPLSKVCMLGVSDRQRIFRAQKLKLEIEPVIKTAIQKWLQNKSLKERQKSLCPSFVEYFVDSRMDDICLLCPVPFRTSFEFHRFLKN